MTQYLKALVLLCAILWANNSSAQNNIFDCEHSREFASYLFNSAQFDLALHELERVNYLCKTDSASQLLLLRTYRKVSQFDKANPYFNNKSFEQLMAMPDSYKQEFVKLQMTQKQYPEVTELINQGFDFKGKQEYLIGSALLLKQWNNAYSMAQQCEMLNSLKINGLKKIAEQSYQAKRKKPWLATVMSVIVPGSGKMYSGYWADGAMSLLFTASSGFFAYRGFNKYGPNKVYPWIAGGIAISYYAANIYGGNRAAVLYNKNLDNHFIHETEHLLFSDY
ncbi:MAG TPA: hypothetical protein VJY41_04460 [Prolixibacteraceae bacterium]|nr:hypothetical protein [Prolixibacteraceae bacterium]